MTKLTHPSKIESFAVIIRAMGGNGADDQRASLAELHKRGLWLGDGANGDDQQAMAISAAGHAVPSDKRERSIRLMAMGYCSPKAQEYISLKVADIKRYSECYKARVVSDPEYHAAQLIEGFTTDEIKRFIREEKEEARLMARHGH